MKKIISLLVILSFSSHVMASGIPVVDAAQLAAQQTEYAQEAARWAETIKQYEADYKMFENQYKKAQQQYNAISGIRDLSGALNYLGAQNWTMDNLTKWLSDPNRIMNAGFDSLDSDLRAKVSQLGFEEMCNYTNSERSDYYQYKLRKNCEGRVVLNILQSAKYKKSVDERKSIDEKHLKLMEYIAQSEDTKQSADNNNQLTGMLIKEIRDLKRMLEDQENIRNAEKTLQLQKDADFKAQMQIYKNRQMKW